MSPPDKPSRPRQLVTYPYASPMESSPESVGGSQVPEPLPSDEVERLAENFVELIAESARDHCLITGNLILGLDAELRILFVNAAWEDKANDNERTSVKPLTLSGRFFPEMIAGPIRRYYERALRRVLYSGEPWHHRYLCPSPTAMEEWRLSAYGLHRHAGLLLNHSLIVQRPASTPFAAIDERYLQDDGCIHICCHCQHTRRAGLSETWDYVFAYLDPSRLPCSSLVLCPACHAYYPDDSSQNR